MMNVSPMTDEGLEFDSLESDSAKFEYAQYIINTPEADRPEITEDNVIAALTWMADREDDIDDDD